MLVWNYASYFWGEASVYWGNSRFIREPLDLTIAFWFMVNIATVIFIYKNDFGQAFESGEEVSVPRQKEFDLDKRLKEVAETFELTSREKDLSKLIYEGKCNGEIAKLLFISESTVKTHFYNIFRKMDVKNRIGVTYIICAGCCDRLHFLPMLFSNILFQ
ncbi:MAG: helix-turn-helix transcriptional regulator [Firmicutes bacterium]|jgi:DNA-binding CsgD family transcriptional regulator|nr:helix-turn-helix transcriptional regulator [Bacillota bacterium]NBI61624.1 LuxR family transcriptional regulator [Clostridiales bacterium]